MAKNTYICCGPESKRERKFKKCPVARHVKKQLSLRSVRFKKMIAGIENYSLYSTAREVNMNNYNTFQRKYKRY